jgi:predicted ATPase
MLWSRWTLVIYGETEGNPFFVEEVYEHLNEGGELFDASGAWRTGLRLPRLREEARRILTTAAVIGRFATCAC